MSIQFYDSLAKKKSEFVPHSRDEVKMYVCGPTVYDLLHVGNFRGPVFYNSLRNWLEYRGYKVNYVYNYTDVDDKIINKSKDTGTPALEISEKYINEFKKDYDSLNLSPHTHNPKVSETMNEIVAFIGDLIEKKKAYESDGDVYFSVKAFDEYGKLSNKNVEDLIAGNRIDVNEQKENPVDFALWKKAKEGEPSWESPWSAGRPGWHIECSVMCQHILGDEIDIHGGGIDLIFPHHENEIAQSEACSGKPYVKYWMHNNMLELGGEKMSKSSGNIMSLREFVEEYNGEVFKYLILSSHYRSVLSFTTEQVQRCISQLGKFYSALSLCENILNVSDVEIGDVPKKFNAVVIDTENNIEKALDDDLNTPVMFAALFDLLKAFNQRCALPGPVTLDKKAMGNAYKNTFIKYGKILALFQEPAGEYLRILDDMLLDKLNIKRETVDELVKERTQVREEKNFQKSDELRDQLVAMGISLQDRSDGTSWEVTK